MFTSFREIVSSAGRNEPPQALSREQFARALELHGFAATVTPFGLQFVDCRRGWRVGGATGGRAGDGRPYLDRLATLHQLLALRRAGDDLAQKRRMLWGRLLAWIAPPAPAIAPVRLDRHPPPRR